VRAGTAGKPATETRRKIHSTATMRRKATTKPISGETTIGMTTFWTIASHLTVIPDATPTPARPPINACVDDDGSPSHQVMRFQ